MKLKLRNRLISIRRNRKKKLPRNFWIRSVNKMSTWKRLGRKKKCLPKLELLEKPKCRLPSMNVNAKRKRLLKPNVSKNRKLRRNAKPNKNKNPNV